MHHSGLAPVMDSRDTPRKTRSPATSAQTSLAVGQRVDLTNDRQPFAVHLPNLQPASYNGQTSDVQPDHDPLPVIFQNSGVPVNRTFPKSVDLQMRQPCGNIHRQSQPHGCGGQIRTQFFKRQRLLFFVCYMLMPDRLILSMAA